MDFLQLAQDRWSCRGYAKKTVEPEKEAMILEAGRIAPTAANRQPQRIVVIKTTEGLEKLKASANIFGAPLAFLVCADHNESWKRKEDGWDAAEVDATIVATHLILQATNLGLSSLWVCHFDDQKIRADFALPQGVQPVNIIAVGYPTVRSKSPLRFDTERKSIEDTVVFESFE